MRFIFLFILLFFSHISFANEDKATVRLFAETVVSIVRSSDIGAFKELNCYPTNCTDEIHTINEIFGGEKIETSFEKILKNDDINIKVIGPYTYKDNPNLKSYSVIFFSDSTSPFDNNGKISEEVGLKELYKSFLQTLITIDNKKVGFHRIPFHLESHHPYAGDYG